ncbi:hypothetical protein JQ506_10020 [Shinella sp. PSBB067]|uniref:hypothetical protein n=1 Tax=Shinella sp. PSBB067 TaxID=2715959 RepID=UPI00193B1349|nr:hypothetical protein [Shinella sp. PSBB067]QRI65278.1 hypothetical protein JQ506_10020 [Shinella sp. PSBB067]
MKRHVSGGQKKTGGTPVEGGGSAQGDCLELSRSATRAEGTGEDAGEASTVGSGRMGPPEAPGVGEQGRCMGQGSDGMRGAQPVSVGLAQTIAEIDHGLMTAAPPVHEGFANAGFPGFAPRLPPVAISANFFRGTGEN